jgi:predicted O-linked N-acetylglucosamine transferase (SPINDLY family)
VALFVHPVLAHHDRSRFEIFCYYSHGEDDAMTRQLRPLAEHWRDIAALDDAAAVEVIRRDEIDLLIDLAGYTGESRLALFAHGAAPVQATWLGYLHSTGMASTDYRISDDALRPARTERTFAQRDARPHAAQPMVLRARARRRTCTGSGGGRDDAVFGAFNPFWKMSDRALDLWLEILRRLPRSQLALCRRAGGHDDAEPAHARREARHRARAHLDCAAQRTSGRILRTWPRSTSHSTRCRTTAPPPRSTRCGWVSRWWHSPAIGRSRAAGRAFLRTLGLPELVAATAAEYVEINVRLAQDRAWRAELRATLRDRMRRSPLMDAAGFTRDLEARYERMHRQIAA